MTRTTRQMTELQRDSFEALAKNFAALQRHNVELTQKWTTGAYRSFFPFTYATYAQEALKVAQQTTEQALEAPQKALEATQQVAQQGLRVAEEATAKAEKATAKAEKATAKAEQATVKAEQAVKTTAKSQEAAREAALQAEEETREVALQTAVHNSLKTKDYNELNVDDVSKKLDGLSATELKKVREYEEHNKNRGTLVEQIDHKIKATA